MGDKMHNTGSPIVLQKGNNVMQLILKNIKVNVNLKAIQNVYML